MKNNVKLRDYQELAVERAVWAAKKFEDNSLVVAATGAGKSLICAGIADELKSECLILSPSKEVLGQNMKKLANYVPEEEIGVYSHSFGRKDIAKFNFATIQSVYQKPELFKHIGLVIVDECDLMNPKNQGSMFTKFLREIGKPKTIGLTATPYRNVLGYEKLKNGNLLATTMLKLVNRMNPRLWQRIVFNINNKDLVERGYLVPLEYEIRTTISHNKIPTNKSRSDFDLEAFEKLLFPFEAPIIESINKSRNERDSVLVFCTSIDQAERMSRTMTKAAVVSSHTPMKQRDAIISDFQSGVINTVFNVNCLSVGFDKPSLDTIYSLRPTRSLRMYYQQLGRGCRIAEGKKSCLVIDYADNVNQLGKVEDIILQKDETNKWELYANGNPMHGKGLFNFVINSKDNKPKSRIKIGGVSI